MIDLHWTGWPISCPKISLSQEISKNQDTFENLGCIQEQDLTIGSYHLTIIQPKQDKITLYLDIFRNDRLTHLTSELKSSADAHPKWLSDPRHIPFFCCIPRECALSRSRGTTWNQDSHGIRPRRVNRIHQAQGEPWGSSVAWVSFRKWYPASIYLWTDQAKEGLEQCWSS